VARRGEREMLACCYRNSLLLASRLGARSIALPGISTGVYGFPPELAAPIAVATTRETLLEASGITSVTFCCFNERDLALYLRILQQF
jgi:O-acetyl-ADP-ribose deacetylase (regulator of RNase III)